MNIEWHLSHHPKRFALAMAVAAILLGNSARTQQLQWTQQSVLQPYSSTNVPARLFMKGNVLFHGYAHGLRRSWNNGQTWDYLDNNVPGTANDQLRVWAVDNAYLYVVSEDIPGKYQRSPDLGATWEDTEFYFNNDDPGGIFNYILAMDSVLYAIRQDDPVDSGGVWRSTDHGMTWEARNNFMYSDANVDVISAMDNYLFASTNNRLYRSQNQGLSWAGLNNAWQDPWPITHLGHFGTRLFAAGSAPFGMRYSDDLGATFAQCSMDGIPAGTGTAEFHQLGGNAYVIWGNTEKHLYASTNSGADWVSIDDPNWAQVYTGWSNGDTMFVLADQINPAMTRCVFMTVVPNIGVQEQFATEPAWTVHLDPTGQALVFNDLEQATSPYYVRVTDALGRVLAQGPLGPGQRFPLGHLQSKGMVVISLITTHETTRSIALSLVGY
jgi:hypothetical protein